MGSSDPQFKPGDRIRVKNGRGRFINPSMGASAFDHHMATVAERGIFSTYYGGPYVDIKWDRPTPHASQNDGGYNFGDFELVSKATSDEELTAQFREANARAHALADQLTARGYRVIHKDNDWRSVRIVKETDL